MTRSFTKKLLAATLCLLLAASAPTALWATQAAAGQSPAAGAEAGQPASGPEGPDGSGGAGYDPDTCPGNCKCGERCPDCWQYCAGMGGCCCEQGGPGGGGGNGGTGPIYPVQANTVFSTSQYTELSSWLGGLDIDGDTVDHIVNGSVGSNHHWEWLVPDKNWPDIIDCIMDAMSNGNIVSEHKIEYGTGSYVIEVRFGYSGSWVRVSTAIVHSTN